MDHQRKALRWGAAVIVLSLTLRLFGGGFLPSVGQALRDERFLSLLVYLQTGRVVRYPQNVVPPRETVPPLPATPTVTVPEPALPVFSAEDLALISVNYGCGYRPDLENLLLSPLDWDLTEEEPAVLIVHTHATEGYAKQPYEDYVENLPYRTLDERYNMVSIGDEVARVLESGGIRVIHDRSFHDDPSYNDSYGNARASIEYYLKQYPSIRMVLDIHRDASDGADGSQLVTVGTVGGQRSAQLMVVVGTDATGNYHPAWQQNLALALKLTAVLEQTDPGLTRPVNLRGERFNMDLTAGSLLIEVGGAGNTHAEALLAANALARGILALAKGTAS